MLDMKIGNDAEKEKNNPHYRGRDNKIHLPPVKGERQIKDIYYK